MKRLLPLASLMVVVFAASSARADGMYFTESFGGTKVKDELSSFMPDGAVRIRVAVGLRHRQWAAELWGGADIDAGDSYYDGGPRVSGLGQYGLDLKYIQPLSRHFEVYLRGSASHAIADGALEGYEGRGLGMGAGIQLKGKGSILGLLWWPLFFTNIGPKMTAAIYLDEGYDFYRLHGPAPTAVDAQLTSFRFGFAVGSDF